jgi:riboflavin kinase / FMN adenylyltransferase
VREINDSDKLKLLNPVITTGTFDGLHAGHQKVIAKTIEIANKTEGTPVIITFWPHPRFVLGKGDFSLLNTFEEKKRLFEEMGIEHVYYQKFTTDFAQLSSEEYVKQILVDKIGVKTLVVGYDHQFGKKRTGKFETLGDMAKKFNFQLEKVDVLNMNGLSVSSTKIRTYLENGRISEANQMLGYDYSVCGKVVEGYKKGREMGFPTANISLSDKHKMIPQDGVYAVYASVEKKFYKGMLSIGYRPTITEQPHNKSIEVNLFDFSGDIYNSFISVYFIQKLRNENKYANIEELKNQLMIDKKNAQILLNGKAKFPKRLM